MATLNLPKADLIARLEDRKAAIVAEYQEATDSVNAELARRAEAIGDSEAHADYYESIAAGLRDGTYAVSATGKLAATRRGEKIPAKPGTKGSSVNSMQGIRGSSPRFRHYENESLEATRDSWPKMLEAEIKPINTAIDLLNLATDDVVQIDSDNYTGLLNGSDGRSRRYHLL